MEILRCEHLTKIYGAGETQVTALSDVSFSVEKGEFVSVIGPSGSGKSTLLHILGGVDKPTSGKVFIDGTDMHALKEDRLAVFRRRQIGLVYQFYNLMPVLNVEENIALPHLLDGRELDRERLDSIIEHLGLTDRRYNLPSQLSGGQQQRVSIGRALYSHPASTVTLPFFSAMSRPVILTARPARKSSGCSRNPTAARNKPSFSSRMMKRLRCKPTAFSIWRTEKS